MPPENNDLDRILSDIRNEPVDPAAIEAAAARVRARLPHAALRSCADFQALIPEYRAGTLPEARALLLKDHTRGCAPCRHALQGPGKVVAFEAPRRMMAAPWFRWALAACMAGVAVLAGWSLFNAVVTGGGRTVVEAANGTVYRVSGQASEKVQAGVEIAGEVRTDQDSGAVVRLGDGSRVEMRERSAFSVSASGRDLTVHLARGSIIVQAAKRHRGHLYVATRDCRVAVTGTVFSVNSGMKGSRVSVIEGEVRVAQGGQEKVLHPGDQYASSASIGPVPVADEIAWSRNVDQHVALLREFSVLQKKLEQVRMPEMRYSSRLAGMLPADTVIYAAIPNLGRAIAEAHQVLEQRASESPVLREWWNQKMGRGDFQKTVEKLRDVSDYLGDEIVVAVPAGPDGRIGSPVFLAEVKKTGLREYIQAEAARQGAGKTLPIADSIEALGATGRGDALMFLGQNLAAVSPDPAALRKVLAGGGFAGTPFGQRVAASYRDGAGFLFAADLEKIVPQTPAGHHEDRPGFEQLKYAILEQKDAGGRTDTHAMLAFRGPRAGWASWLGKPGANGALDYVSPDAGFAAAFILKSPAAIFDEVLMSPADREGLAKAEADLGLSLRNDLAAALGSEIAVALDGPAIPVPSWKLAVEVKDAARFGWAIQKLVETVNQVASAHGKQGAQLTQETVSGRTWYRLSIPELGKFTEASYTFADGYLIAAPNRALIERAIQNRAAGYTLTRSQGFAALLPRDRYADFSGMVYQNMGPTLGPVIDALKPTKALTPEQKKALEGVTSELAKAMLVTVYGEEDRITLACVNSLLGLTPANLMRLASPLGLVPGITGGRHEARLRQRHD